MNYTEGINYMRQYIGQRGYINPFSDIVLNYPGRKNIGDYQLSLTSGQVPTHATICNTLYNFIKNDIYTYDKLLDFLIDVYSNGTSTPYKDTTLEYYKHLIYWITLQEEINYPRARGYAGINLAFCRFFEAIYCSQPSNIVTIASVVERCNNHGRNKPTLFNIEDVPNFYRY